MLARWGSPFGEPGSFALASCWAPPAAERRCWADHGGL